MGGKFEYGPVRTYEITWNSGHIETVLGHQVSWPNNVRSLFGVTTPEEPRRIMFHAEIDGVWTLTLSAFEDDIRTIRDVTQAEQIRIGA